jgi:phenol 2-monooxygenase
VNLSWKLSGVLRGLYNPLVLSTYQTERKPIALSLIKTDKRISSLISGNTAPQKGEINSDTSKDSNALLAETFQRSAEIIVGLGIKYAPNILNKDPSTGTLPPGHRAPDALLRSPGSPLPTRLYSVTKNYGCFYVLVFAGYPFHTLAQLQNFRTYIDSPGSFTRRGHPDAIRFVTIISGNGPSPDEALGIERFGNAYYDYDGSAHARYGISEDTGAAVILRPDGYFAFATMLDRGEEVGEYFERILKLTGPRAEANGVH